MTTFTREDYAMAAKAVGFDSFDWLAADNRMNVYTPEGRQSSWNPITDDGDALRLAVALRLQVTPGTYNSEEVTAYRSGHAESHERVHFQQDIGAATRHAIFRAAIAIGRAML